jgi:hypothetical protein
MILVLSNNLKNLQLQNLRMDNRTDYINDNNWTIIIKNNTDVFLKALIYDVILGMKIATS